MLDWVIDHWSQLSQPPVLCVIVLAIFFTIIGCMAVHRYYVAVLRERLELGRERERVLLEELRKANIDRVALEGYFEHRVGHPPAESEWRSFVRVVERAHLIKILPPKDVA